MMFDVREATIKSIQDALYSGKTSCEEVTRSFLARIEALNPAINAIIALNPNAVATAINMDQLMAAGNATGHLFGIPIMLKDNFDTFDMPTTAGCLALARSQSMEDAPTVKALRRENAIILGKANMHELALEGLSVSSLGGQSVNPYDSTRTPGGSSGGSAAAVAMSFCVFATGTDTMNSLRSPASANSLFSCRPTRGLITKAGVVPVSSTQDVVGPIARTTLDLAIALSVMQTAGPEEGLKFPDHITHDYTNQLDNLRLNGLRLGLIDGFVDREMPESEPVNRVIQVAITSLEALGVTIVPIDESFYNSNKLLAELDTQRYEFRENMDRYLQRGELKGQHPATLNELFETGDCLVVPRQYEHIKNVLSSSTKDGAYHKIQLGIEDLKSKLDATFTRHKLDAVIYPQQKHLVVKLGSPSQSGRNGILAALTGFPVVTVPLGFSPPSAEALRGVPIGLEIMGRPWSEGSLLQIAYQLEIHLPVRRPPEAAEVAVDIELSKETSAFHPDSTNIPTAYPLGFWKLFRA